MRFLTFPTLLIVIVSLELFFPPGAPRSELGNIKISHCKLSLKWQEHSIKNEG